MMIKNIDVKELNNRFESQMVLIHVYKYRINTVMFIHYKIELIHVYT